MDTTIRSSTTLSVSDHQGSDEEDVLTHKCSLHTCESTETAISRNEEVIESLRRQSSTTLKHCYSVPAAETFHVRSKTYMKDKKKVASDNSVFLSRGVDVFESEDFAPTHVGRHSGLLGGKLRDAPTFLVNLRFSWGALVLYYEIPSKFLSALRNKYHPSSSTSESSAVEDFTSPHDKAIHRFLCSDDDCKTSALKLIPRIVEGNIIVKKLVTGRPVIIGNKVPISWVYEPADSSSGKAEYLEADLDIGSSSKSAQRIVGVCRKYMKSLAVDFGWVIEASEGEELPERLLACTRIHHVDAKMLPKLRWKS